MMSQTQNQNVRIIKSDPAFSPHSIDLTVSSQAVDDLIMEGGQDFYNYVNKLGLAKSNMIVLSSKHHYYYDADEIKRAKTFVHLKELNLIKQIRNLLGSYMLTLPENCSFVGSFINNEKFGRYALRNRLSVPESRKNSENAGLDIVSANPFINMMYNLMDRKTNTYMTEKIVTEMLGEYNFEVLDMTEHNERTYFHSRKVVRSYN